MPKKTPPIKSGIDGNFSFKRTFGKIIFEIIAENENKITFKEAENILREALGYPLKGKGFDSELLLFNFIKDTFPETKVILHGKPAFLENQHYDVWLPEINVAVEYQGEQHRISVDYFGGDAALAKQKERDKKKRTLSRKNGVKLFYIRSGENYTSTVLDKLIAEIADILIRRKTMTLNPEDQRKQAFELFVRALAAASDSLVKPLTGKEYAQHAVEGAKIIEEYLFPKTEK